MTSASQDTGTDPAQAAQHGAAVACIGSVHWDTIAVSDGPLAEGLDQPGEVQRRIGGVAFNVASALRALGHRPKLAGIVGSGSDGDALRREVRMRGIEADGILRSSWLESDSYVAIEAGGRVLGAVADCRSLESIGPDLFRRLAAGLFADPKDHEFPHAVIDGNLPGQVLSLVGSGSVLDGAVLSAVAASTGKIKRMLGLRGRKDMTLYANRKEAELLTGNAHASSADAAMRLVRMGFERAVVTNGTAAAADASGSDVFEARPRPADARILTGSGDCFAAAHISARLRQTDRTQALSDACDFAAAYVAGTQELRPHA